MARSIVFGPARSGTPEEAERLISFVHSYLSGDRRLPTPVQASRTSAVFRVPDPAGDGHLCIKAYAYKRFRQVLRGFHRNTFLGPSRAKREWINLARLVAIGVPTPEPVALVEIRRWRALRAAAVATAWVDDTDTLERALIRRPPHGRRAILEETARITSRMHAAGYTDGDLHARNLLVRIRGNGREPEVLKIDSPAGRMRASLGRQWHDLASLDVAARRILTRSERLRFFRQYACGLVGPPNATAERRWFTAIAHRVRMLEPKEGPRVDEALVREANEPAPR